MKTTRASPSSIAENKKQIKSKRQKITCKTKHKTRIQSQTFQQTDRGRTTATMDMEKYKTQMKDMLEDANTSDILQDHPN